MAEFQRKSIKFTTRGIQISRPVDLLDEGYFLSLKNVRVQQDGAIQQRPGLTAVTSPAVDTPIHSIRRLNNDVAGASQAAALVVGGGTKLYTSDYPFSTLTERDTGYSGNPLSIVPTRPSSSPEPWMYIGDSSKMRKINVAGTDYPIGIAPPNTAAAAALGIPTRKVISDFDTAAGWTQGGTAGAPSVTADNRVNTTIAAILYDSGTTGWALVKPTAMTDDIQPGLRLTFGAAAEIAVVEQVFSPVADSTIGSITYDSGTSGLCTIQLGVPSPIGIAPNMLLYNSTQTEYVRVLDVTAGPDGLVSFRCSTAATFAATNVIQGPASFRAYLTGTRAGGDALKATFMTSAVTTGIGYVDATSALDLSVSSASGRPYAEDDEIHCSIRVDHLTALTEGRLYFDVDGSTNDFTQNYFYFAFRPNDLTGAIANLQTTLAAEQIALQREIEELRNNQRDLLQEVKLSYYQPPGFELDWKGSLITKAMIESGYGDPNWPGDTSKFGQGGAGPSGLGPGLPGDPTGGSASPGQTASGDSQWSELKFKLKDLVRVGSDTTKTLRDVKAIRVQVNVTAAINLDMDSWWIGGSYGPDAQENPITYRWRYRSSTTGAVSNPSPGLRSGVEPHREQVVLTGLTASSDSQVDFKDIYRRGGTLLDWTYVGSVANATTTFTDNYLDDELFSNPILEFDNFQPFPVLDTPKAGTCNVSGTKVTRASGDNFNTSWAPGSIIIIDGVAYTLYASPTSTTVLETVENVGTKSGVAFTLPSPTLQGQPLPVLFGPYGGGETGIFIFALGSTQQPGTLFWTKGNDPDSAPTANQLEITSPSEPLVAGCIYDGRPYVFTSERMYVINRSFDGTSDFVAQEVANSKGVIGRWCVAVGEKIFFVSKDGIYATDGTGTVKSLTDAGLYNFFPHDAGANTLVGLEYQGLIALDITAPKFFRLSQSNDFLYFIYKTSGVYYTLVYDLRREAWFQEVYSPTIVCYYQQEGDGQYGSFFGLSNGTVYKYGTGADTSSHRVLTPFYDLGDSRSQKLIRDIVIDADRGGFGATPAGTLTVKIYINNNLSTVYQTFTLSGGASGAGRQQAIIDVNSGIGVLARTIALELTWTDAVTMALYEWSPSWLVKSEQTEARFTDWTDAGIPGDKRVTGFIIDADTYNNNKSIQIQYDGGVVAQTFTVNHNGQRKIAYALATPFIAKLLRLGPWTPGVGADETPWYLEGVDWIYELVPEFLALQPDYSDDGDPRAKWLQGFELEADTGGSNVTLTLQGDGATLETFTANHNGRLVVPYSLTPSASGQLPIVHEMRLLPNGNIRVWKINWVWVPEAELVKNYITPGMVLEPGRDVMNPLGFYHLKDCYITHRSTSDITFVISVDGTDTTMTIPNSGGLHRKTYLVLPVLKGKSFQFRLTSTTNFRLYADDSEVRAKVWGSEGDYQVFHPFGVDRPLEHGGTAAEI